MSALQPDRTPVAHHTHPLGLAVGAVLGLGRLVVPVFAVMYSAAIRDGGLALIAGLLVAIILVSVGYSWVRWRRFVYTIGDEDIRVDSGVINRTARSVPYERIQDVSLEQKLIPRLFGLVEVRFETGAGGKDELKLAYVSRDEGERLRELVRERREGTASVSSVSSVSAAETRTSAEPPPIFALDLRRLLTFGLFEFSLVIFAVLLGVAQQLDFLLPFDIWEWENWDALLGEQGDRLVHLGRITQLVAGLFALVSLILLGLLTGILRTVAWDFGFRLDRTAKGFRRRRGLFTVTDVVMPAHRVQAAVIKTGWLRRLFGWHSLEFVSLAQDSKQSSSHVVAPFASMEEIWPIAEAAGLQRPADGLVWHRPSKEAYVDSALLISLILFAIALGLLVAAPEPWAALLPLVFVPPIIVLHILAWHRHAHALDGRQIYIRTGILAPQLSIAQQAKLQSAEIAQGPIARRRGYAKVNFGLAGGTLATEEVSLAEARHMRDSVMERVAEIDFSDLPR